MNGDSDPDGQVGDTILTAPGFRRCLEPVLPGLTARARRLTGSAADADDLVQDTLLRAWRARASFDPGTNLKAWLFRIQRNSFLSDVRRERPWTDLSPREVEGISSQPPVQEGFLLEADLSEAIEVLNDDQRAVVFSVAAGQSYDEAAGRLGLSVTTFKARLNRARARLRACGERPARSRAVDTAVPRPSARPAAGPRRAIYQQWKRSGVGTIG